MDAIRQVKQWTLVESDNPDHYAYHTLLECGHVYENQYLKGVVSSIPSHVICMVCQQNTLKENANG